MPKILLVDDDLTLSQMYQERLTIEGFEVEVAQSGQEALIMVDKSRPDLILLDIMMPGLDGFQILEKLRDNPATKNIPILLVTALIQETMRIKGRQLGASDFIVKSETTPGQLVLKIKEHLPSADEAKEADA